MGLGENLKFLRKQAAMTQERLSAEIGINRSTLADYERNASCPKPDGLRKIADFFQVTIDSLFTDDVVKTDKVGGQDFRILAITVDRTGKENIVFVSQKSENSYVKRFQETSFLKELPNFWVPKLENGNYRAFEISSDAMPPINSGSIVICSYVKNILDVIDNHRYVLVTKNGIVFKRVRSISGSLELISDNLNYRPYIMLADDILEVWRFDSVIAYGESDVSVTVDNLFSKLNAIDTKIDLLVNQ